jgi:Xaa-Pro dipeptidase
MTDAIARIRGLMSELDLHAVVLKTRSNFSWVTGGRDNHIIAGSEFGVADLIIFANRVVCVMPSIEEKRIVEEELKDFDCEVMAPNWIEGTEGTLHQLLSGARVGVDTYHPIGENISTKLSAIRRILTSAQQVQYRSVSQIAAQAVEKVAMQLQQGDSEFEIAARVGYEVTRNGCLANVVLVSTDERVYAYRHPIPTSKVIDKYAMLVVCAEKYGLVANATRFVHFGELPSQLQENKEKCAYIDVQMNTATQVGRQVSDVFQVAMDAYREVGYPDDWKFLHQGGPTGYASREYLVTPQSTDLIHAGQAYAWNPAVRGIKSEDTILVGEQGNEFLTHTGNWPYIQVEKAGTVYYRPDILIR